MILKSEKMTNFLSDLEDEYSKIIMEFNRIINDGVQEELKITVTDINNKQYEITLVKGLAKTKINGNINDYEETVVVSNIKCITEIERIREHIRVTNAKEFTERSEIMFDRKIDEVIELNVKIYFNFYNWDEKDAFSDEIGEPDLIERYEFQDTKNLLKIIYKNFNKELKEIQF